VGASILKAKTMIIQTQFYPTRNIFSKIYPDILGNASKIQGQFQTYQQPGRTIEVPK
jgi:hypothetical protein